MEGHERSHDASPDEPLFVVDPRVDAEGGVVVLRGEFDLDGRERFAEAVGRLVAEGVRAVRIDAGGLSFIDSSGFAALLSARNILNQAGVAFELAPVSPEVKYVIALGGVEHVLLPDAPDHHDDGTTDA